MQPSSHLPRGLTVAPFHHLTIDGERLSRSHLDADPRPTGNAVLALLSIAMLLLGASFVLQLFERAAS